MSTTRTASALAFPAGTRVQVSWAARGLPIGVAGSFGRVIGHADQGALFVRLDGQPLTEPLIELLIDEVVNERDAEPGPVDQLPRH